MNAGRRSKRLQTETSDAVGTQENKTRSKNFTEAECKMLISACDKFHEVINKNSNRDSDKAAKNDAWHKIKMCFGGYCKAEAIFVSVFIFLNSIEWSKPLLSSTDIE